MKQKKRKKKREVNQVKITFTKKPMTAWGGLGVQIGKLLEVIGFREWVEKKVPIREESNNGGGIFEKLLSMFITVLCGGSRFSHVGWWSYGEEVLRKVFGVKWLPKAGTTLTRFFGKFKTQRIAEGWGEAARELAVSLLKWENIFADELYLDSSVLTRYGEQEGAKKGYNPKKRGRNSHHPLLAFVGSGYVMNLWNRRGDTFSGQNASDFFNQTITALGELFKVRRVICDSGFYLVKFIVYLETRGYSYIIAVPMIAYVQKRLYEYKEWKRIENGIEVGSFHFKHIDKKWDKERRYVVVRQAIKQHPKAAGKQLTLPGIPTECTEYRYSLYVTDDEQTEPEEIWRTYRPRACVENIIKDLKEGYSFGTFSLQNFWATEAVMVLNALVFHNLIHYLNRYVFNSTKPQQQLKTLRSKRFIIPAELGNSARKSIVRLGIKDKKQRGKLLYYFNRIALLPHRL